MFVRTEATVRGIREWLSHKKPAETPERILEKRRRETSLFILTYDSPITDIFHPSEYNLFQNAFLLAGLPEGHYLFQEGSEPECTVSAKLEAIRQNACGLYRGGIYTRM